MKLYSASTKGFYDESIHGARVAIIAAPGWSRPTITVTVQPGESITAEVDGELRQVTNDTDAPVEYANVPDMSVDAPTLAVPNPDCKIPADAVEISDDEHAALLDAQGLGKVIQADAGGRPTAVDFVPSAEQLWAGAQSRAKAALDASDSTILRCAENGVTVPAAWIKYRKDLRAIVSAKTGDGTQALPPRPAFPAGT